MDIRQNIITIYDNISKINSNVSIVAATKTRTMEDINTALSTNKIDACGENKVQELLSKYNEEVKWDFIGQLQTNKVKSIIGKVRLIHSLDRISLAKEIDKQAKAHNIIQECLIEINSGEEIAKGGIFLQNLNAFLDEVTVFDNISLSGIMAVAPKDISEALLGQLFDRIYAKFTTLQNENFRYLSMGMSNDYLTAVKAGANMVRLGRAIFGERNECTI